MLRGQISLDFIFAILMLLIVIQSMQIMAEYVTTGEQVKSIRLQERQILSDLKAAIEVENALAGVGAFSYSYDVPMIAVPGIGDVGCTILATPGKLSITVLAADSDLDDDIIESVGITAGTTGGNCGNPLNFSG